ncbi:phage tail sheath family protein [Aliikangiella coralliicola]|uniref:Phage tail protein n=1 Tax=Aliikangiella coralliicola TaxID=2592383 RepID=A0A545UD99_9GAMM|nr:phage tail sheath C-terminal domain-containing protein [Aliikangiella coralliicola]TQV87438.1 phage tail protein [Aliikangiella coralliicola]
MPSYKTPDVYVEEISIFPPSVAQVETAIPAFIGYTEKAQEFSPQDLHLVPTRVKSLLEYQELFGDAPPVAVNSVKLDENNGVSSTDVTSNFYMYDALRMFFKNGGGKCYIISVGLYKDNTGSISKDHFNNVDGGLAVLKKQDEPTIILFPDAVLLESDDLYDLQQQALKQCNTLQDRVAVFDLLESKSTAPTFDWEEGYNEFRNKIGINYLKYGAAYTPWLKTNLSLDVRYRDIKGKVMRGGAVVSMDVLTDDAEVKTTVANIDKAVADADTISGDLDTLNGAEETLKAKYTTLLDDYKGAPDTTKYKALFTFIYSVVDQIDAWSAGAAVLTNGELVTNLGDLITNSLKATVSDLISYDRAADTALTGSYNLYTTYDPTESANWGDIFGASAPAANDIFGAGTNTEKQLNGLSKINDIFEAVNAAVAEIVESATTYESTYENTLLDSHPTFKNIIKKLSTSLTTMPPSGAIAGIYAMVDSTRGVWKAPANVSVSGVVGLTENIDSIDQEELNVDVNGGKSINCIRAFTGRGTLVWGARTLAGNDNEWRYVSVRRFFNMVEESVKKSTYWAVFEPNDANTWIKVKTMIENFLTLQWRDGALQGAKPNQAFFVNVGLGTTMTPQDILEGRMNVEIGMAVVRPAEFIILKFSHKLPEA